MEQPRGAWERTAVVIFGSSTSIAAAAGAAAAGADAAAAWSDVSACRASSRSATRRAITRQAASCCSRGQRPLSFRAIAGRAARKTMTVYLVKRLDELLPHGVQVLLELVRLQHQGVPLVLE